MLLSSRVPVLLLALLLATPSLASDAPSATGHWDGAIETPAGKLGVNVDLVQAEDGPWSGDISIPLQGLTDFALSDVSVTGSDVAFKMPGIPGDPAFKGKLAADGASIAGDFTQGGAAMTFSLARAQPPGKAAAAALEGFDAWVDDARVAWKVPGCALAIVKDGQVIEAKGFGMRDQAKSLPVTEKTLFAIGSCSKAFTTFVMGTLVDEGKLDWDSPVRSYIPGFQLSDPIATQLIAPRDLVTHRSGLPRHDLVWYNATGLSRKDLVDRLRYLEPSAQLREKFQYNNLMVMTAGYLTEQVSGKSWEDLVGERILQPLGMTRTNFAVATSQADADFARPYRDKDDAIVPMAFRIITNMGPAGSINSSIEDMAKWAMLHVEGGKAGGRQLISAETLKEIHSPQMVTGQMVERKDISPAVYGLGWDIVTYRGHENVEHGGAIDGFTAEVSLFPADRIAIVVLSNLNGSSLPGLVARHAADRLLGLERVDWNAEALAKKVAGEKADDKAKARKDDVRKPGTQPSHDLAAYAGTYSHPGYGKLVVALSAGALSLTYNGITAPLEHWHYDVFNAHGGADPTLDDLKFNFRTDVMGDIESVSSQFEPAVKDVLFERQPDSGLSDPAWLARCVGQYDLEGQVITVALEGSTLTVKVPGQPLYHLEPSTGRRYTLKEASIVSVEFKADAVGNVTAAQFNQPNGVFTATRK